MAAVSTRLFRAGLHPCARESGTFHDTVLPLDTFKSSRHLLADSRLTTTAALPCGFRAASLQAAAAAGPATRQRRDAPHAASRFTSRDGPRDVSRDAPRNSFRAAQAAREGAKRFFFFF
jgi:hypothetical protein